MKSNYHMNKIKKKKRIQEIDIRQSMLPDFHSLHYPTEV